jgi:hypothetical protein
MPRSAKATRASTLAFRNASLGVSHTNRFRARRYSRIVSGKRWEANEKWNRHFCGVECLSVSGSLPRQSSEKHIGMRNELSQSSSGGSGIECARIDSPLAVLRKACHPLWLRVNHVRFLRPTAIPARYFQGLVLLGV